MARFALLENVWEEPIASSSSTGSKGPSHYAMAYGEPGDLPAVPDVPEPKSRPRKSLAKKSLDDPDDREDVPRHSVRMSRAPAYESPPPSTTRKPDAEDEDERDDDPGLTVHITDPNLVQHLEAFREGYRDRVVEDLLHKALNRWSFRDLFGGSKETFVGALGVDTREKKFEMLLYLWIGIALVMFFLLVSSG